MSTEAPEEPPALDRAEGGEPGAAPPPGARSAGAILPLVIIVVLAGGIAALIASESGGKKQLPAGESAGHAATLDGQLLEPVRAAPPLSTLHNNQGQPVSLAGYRGKAVFVTFLYTHCPDICPLIASQLHNVLAGLGSRASEVRLVAVSVDPRGDTPAAVSKFLREHDLTGQMQYLIGSARELAPVWKAWGVGSQQDVGNPEFVNHSALVYGITASGKLKTVYAANFKPAEIEHDVAPLLSS